MFYHRGFCHDVEALHFKVIALCVVFCLSTFGPCTMTSTHNPMNYNEYGSYKNDLNSGSQEALPRDICRRSDLFCFPSTLSGYFSDFHNPQANGSGFSGVKSDETVPFGSTQQTDDLNLSSNHGYFQFSSGNVVSCSLELKESARSDSSDENDTLRKFNKTEESVRIKSSIVNDFSSLNVQISHPLLDWGQTYLHFPSLAFLTLENKHNRNVLNVFEPYSTNLQFYPCNHGEIKIGPGEIASICFVFLPKWLGLSSGHLILQTSSGGFLVQAQGFAVESPYGPPPSIGLNLSSSGKWSNVVSLLNPSDKTLNLKEISAWITFSSRNVSYSVKGVCSTTDHTDSFEFDHEWLDVKISQFGQPVMAMRPPHTWTVGSNRNEPILELEFLQPTQANIFGSLCVQLLNNASKNNLDTIILEAELGKRSGLNDQKYPLSISLEILMPCDANGTTSVSLLVENGGQDVLTVVKISTIGENTISLQTKYVEGLVLFPHSVTQVAMVTYTVIQHMKLNCKLLVQTNKSNARELEISCSDIARICSQSYSYAGYRHLNYDNAETISSNVHVQTPLGIKETEVDESVLGNWRSQGTKNRMSVLDANEVMFHTVHVGTHQSKWITVINPSDQPVVMQLILNSGEIINECQGSDEILQPSSSYNLVLNEHVTPSRYGFSIAGNALTEAYVHPRGKAVLGPIIFHPGSRCTWKSSALVRNNLSGVEWLSLRGSGGSFSLILLDGSDPVDTIEIHHNGQPSMKVLFVKNTGDLPVKVNRISVSGTTCELDGFVVGGCKGFGLQPGESRKIIISYRPDVCVETIRRELELAMSGGILVVPIEVGFPTPMLAVCKRSLNWSRFKKVVLAVIVSVFLMFIACSCTFSFTIRDGNSNLSKTFSGPEEHSLDVCSKPENLEVKTGYSNLSKTFSGPKEHLLDVCSKPENLEVKTGKEKAARRRKKKKGSGPGLTGHFEVSSSHSSNSTPSSPLSPASTSTPKRSPETRNPFKHGRPTSVVVVPVKEKPCTPRKTIAPFERAPGPKRKAMKPEEDAKLKYNIWDYHLQLDSLSGQLEAVLIMPEDKNFVSLFAMTPQEFFKTYQPESVSSKKVG